MRSLLILFLVFTLLMIATMLLVGIWSDPSFATSWVPYASLVAVFTLVAILLHKES